MGLYDRVLVILVCAVVLSTCQKEEEIPEDARRIDFSSKGITEVLADFSGFTELEEIDYSNNDIVDIKPDAFSENSKLRYINLSGNKNLDFPQSGPFLFTEAKIVNLSNCHIESIPGNALDEMKNLDVLDLSNNNINFETSLAFQNLENPPRKLIISAISPSDLELICKHVDMIVVIKQNGVSKKCRDVRKQHSHGEKNKPANSETSMEEENDADMAIIEENLLKVDGTHMEMLSDQPDDGSGFGEDNQIENETNEDGEGKTEKSKEETDVPANKSEETAETETIPEENLNTIEENTGDDKLNNEEQNHSSESVNEEQSTSGNVEVGEGKSNREEDGIEVEAIAGLKAEESVEEDEIKPVVIDGTGAQDEIVTDDIVPKRSKGRSKAAPKGNKEEFYPPKGDGDKVNEATVEVLLNNGENNTLNARMAETPQTGETVETPTSAASSIILILIVAVVVVGSSLIGYRYYKSRKTTYSPVNGVSNENPTEGKELKEIVVAKQESQPLMEPRSDIQFEEIDEKNEKNEEEVVKEEDVKQEHEKDEPDVKTETNTDGGEVKKSDNE